jgi:hypothetical protein
MRARQGLEKILAERGGESAGVNIDGDAIDDILQVSKILGDYGGTVMAMRSMTSSRCRKSWAILVVPLRQGRQH